MTNPGAGPGGAAHNHAFVQIEGGRHRHRGCGFQRQGNNVPPVNTAARGHDRSGVVQGAVAFGLNGWPTTTAT